jgi:metal-dependent amidase/aminoacylase/carboxypeptidase family protein
MGTAEVLSHEKRPARHREIHLSARGSRSASRRRRFMVKGRRLNKPVDAVFGVHINAQTEVGNLTYRLVAKRLLSDRFTISTGGKARTAPTLEQRGPRSDRRPNHNGLQTIVSREIATDDAAVVTVAPLQRRRALQRHPA